MNEKKICTITIEGETPSKKNSRITLRNGRTIPSKNYQQWHKEALSQIRAPENPINYPVLIHLVFTHGDLRRRDSDNGCSSIMDTLVDAGVLADSPRHRNYKQIRKEQGKM